MRIVLLGFTMPDENMAEILRLDANMPVQTHAFAWALVQTLRSAGMEVRLLSAAPVSNYPRNPKVWFRGGRFRSEGIEGVMLGFINVLVLKHVTRFVACLLAGTRMVRRWRPDILLIHGVHSPYLLYGAFSRRLTGAVPVVVLTDPPGVVLPSDGALVRALKRIDAAIVCWLVHRAGGVVVLTASLASDFAAGVPYVVMEGILSAEPSRARTRHSVTEARLLYAGGLTDAYGVRRLVEGVCAIEDKRIRLSVFGKGPLEDWINDCASRDVRVERVRFTSRDLVVDEYLDADLLVQPRPTDQHFVRYSFPSKLIEYMASGTPVLTTRLSGIPVEYEQYLYWIEDDSVQGISNAIEEVMRMPIDERDAKGIAAARFVRDTRSPAAQGERIRRFFSDLLMR